MKNRKEVLADIKATVKEFGYVIIPSLADIKSPAEEVQIPLCYTVGLYESRKQPDIFTLGMPHDIATNAIRELLGRNDVPCNDQLDAGLNISLMLLECEQEKQPTIYQACPVMPAYYKTDDIPVRQLVWQDEKLRFPWQENYSMDPRLQPLFGTPPRLN